jgi:hypothetical protein
LRPSTQKHLREIRQFGPPRGYWAKLQAGKPPARPGRRDAAEGGGRRQARSRDPLRRPPRGRCVESEGALFAGTYLNLFVTGKTGLSEYRVDIGLIQIW